MSRTHAQQLLSADIETQAPLTREDEVRLGTLARQGDLNARNELVTRSLRLASHWAGRATSRSCLSYDDLLSAAFQGLMRAADKFDPTRGCRFSTSATHWVRAFLDRSILDSGLVHAPDSVLKASNRVLRERYRLENESGSPPSGLDLAEATGVSLDRVFELLSVRLPTDSLDEPVSHGDDYEESETDSVADPSSPDFGDELDLGQLQATIRAAMDWLPAAERDALERYYEFSPDPYSSRQHASARREGLRSLAQILPRSLAAYLN